MPAKPIAIVGVGAILPDAPNVPAFWENIRTGKYSIGELPPGRWDPALYYDPDPSIPDKTYSKIGAFVRDFHFDPLKLGIPIPPRVLEQMDIAQQWGLAAAHQALQDYGYPKRPLDPNRVAVILGNVLGGEYHINTSVRIYAPEYQEALRRQPAFQQLPPDVQKSLLDGMLSHIRTKIHDITEDTMPGELGNVIAGRIANAFNFSGPNFVTDAACASSLAAIQAACDGLHNGQFDAVLTGGSDRSMGVDSYVKFCKIGALSPDGSRPFSEGANGFVMGEGAAIFLLKRLEDAERDGDKIYAVIRGIGGSSDGKGKGITAPNPLGQQRAIERAWRNAGLSPASANLIEAHGTSTIVGDVTEANSLNAVLGPLGLRTGQVGLGSVKSNIGHLKSTAGAAALLKTILALKEQVLPPSTNFTRPNPDIDFAHLPFAVVTSARAWEKPSGEVRRAGISSFGFGGTNFHLVVEEHIPGLLTDERRIFPAGVAQPVGQVKYPEGVKHPEGVSLPAAAQPAPVPATRRDREEIKTFVLTLVSEKTGYPPEMLDLDLDLEADLGIDTVKQAELFAALRSHYQIPRRPDLRLSDYNTLAKVIQFMEEGIKTTTEVATTSIGAAIGKAPLRPILFLSADTPAELSQLLAQAGQQAAAGQLPERAAPSREALAKTERIAIDCPDLASLQKAIEKALKAMDANNPGMWQALTAQGVYHGSGAPGKVAFLFPGQGSQYVNMLRDLRQREPVVAETFNEADAVMTPILGKPLTSYIFVEGGEEAIAQAEKELKNTAITQPAMLTANVAIMRLLNLYGYYPDYVIGHSLGEYAALVAAGVLNFAEAVEIVSARGRQMSQIALGDNGCMAAISAPLPEVERILKTIDGYVVIANYNGPLQSVIGGETPAVDAALAVFQKEGHQAVKIPVSHAFHTRIVAPASDSLRSVLTRMNIQPPRVTVIANVTGEYYPTAPAEIIEILAQQVASPVQMVKSMQTLYNLGARVFIESGPKRVLNALVSDNLKDKSDIIPIGTNHPRKGDLPSFNEALCALYASGVLPQAAPTNQPAPVGQAAQRSEPLQGGDDGSHPPATEVVTTTATPTATPTTTSQPASTTAEIKAFVLGLVSEKTGYPTEMLDLDLDLEADLGIDTVKQAELFAALRSHYNIPRRPDLRLSDYNTLAKVIRFMEDGLAAQPAPVGQLEHPEGVKHPEGVSLPAAAPQSAPKPAAVTPTAPAGEPTPTIRGGSVVISGVGLGLPGRNRHVFEDSNIQALLAGEQRIDPFPTEIRQAMAGKRVQRLVKSEAGAVMQTIDDVEETVKLAGQRGAFDPLNEFGIPAERLETFDITTQLAVCAGIEALRDAGIPLVMAYKQTSKGTYLPDRWRLPEALADETGVIFGSAFPGADAMAQEAESYYRNQSLVKQADELRRLIELVPPGQPEFAAALSKRIAELEAQIAELDYHFDRKYVFRILSMGHSQFAEYIGARGPNTHVNAACATTTHAIAIAEDWIRAGRCRRVVIIAGDDVTSGSLPEWIGTSLMASGAATVEGNLRLAALPFDRRRNGMIMGMGAAGLVIETEDAVRERGLSPVCEILATAIANSAFHGTRLDLDHVNQVMDRLLTIAEKRYGITREQLAPQTVFVSHETYTPARGGSAAAEIRALRQNFGPSADQIVIANTKGYTGHSMGVGIEDVIAAKALEYGIVPPIAHIHHGFEADPELGDLNLSRGGTYPVQFALRLGAGFGSQLAMTLLHKVPRVGHRLNEAIYRRWLDDVTGYTNTEIETVQRTLRIRNQGQPIKPPARSTWKYGEPLPYPSRLAPQIQPEPAAPQPVTVKPAALPTASIPTTVMVASAPAARVAPSEGVLGGNIPVAADIKAFILSAVSEKTGYPPEMLDLDLDLEGDLGIDTVKQAELFALIRTHYNIPRRPDLRLSDYNTLAKVMTFIEDGLKAVQTAASDAAQAAQPQAPVAPAAPTEAQPEAPRVLIRRVPLPVLRPRLDLCQPTGVDLNPLSRVILVSDDGKVGASLARRLRARKVRVLSLEPGSAVTETISNWLTEGPIQGIYFLKALDPEPVLANLTIESWQAANQARIYTLAEVMRALPSNENPFLVCATRQGGLHGYGPGGAAAPLGGAISGFAKSYGMERPDAFVKVVDFEEDLPASTAAERLLAETLNDRGAVEIGWENELRFGIQMIEAPLSADDRPAIALPEQPVHLISGGTGGIISPIVLDLARSGGGRFFLLNRTPLPAPDDPDLALLKRDRKALRLQLAERMAKAEGRAMPSQVEARLGVYDRAAAALETIAAVQALGARVDCLPCDVTDPAAVQNAVQQVLQTAGRVDVFIHAAGMDRSRRFENKPPEEFRQIFSIKADGFFNIYKSLAEANALPKAVVLFSSVAGRFGNSGQTDYAAANDLLCKLAAAIRRQHPAIQAIAIDWGAWAEVGMASRGNIPQLMQRAGITMLPPSEGAPCVRCELQAGTIGEVMLAAPLGMLEQSRKPEGGLDVERGNRALTEGNPIHVMTSRLTGMDAAGNILLEAELDPTAEPFLKDHALNGIPVLPGVVGIEGFTIAARHVASVLASTGRGFTVNCLEDVRFETPFKFYRDQPRQVTWRARVVREAGGLVATITLESRLALKTRPAEEVRHFSGRVFLSPSSEPLAAAHTTPPHWNGSTTVSAEDIYRLYFHGPAFQVLAGVQRQGETVLGKLASNLPPFTSRGPSPVTIPLLIELCLQTAGIWEVGVTGVLALPRSIGELIIHRRVVGDEPVYAEVTPGRDPDGRLCFDARVIDEKGNLYLEMHDYRTTALPYSVEENLIQPLKALI